MTMHFNYNNMMKHFSEKSFLIQSYPWLVKNIFHFILLVKLSPLIYLQLAINLATQSLLSAVNYMAVICYIPVYEQFEKDFIRKMTTS